MTALDPRFAKTVALMRSTQHEGERISARAKATEIARQCGMNFDQALAQVDRPATPAQPANIFAGFDDWVEAREPGWKAKRAAEKAERERKRLARVAEAVARHGSPEAVLAPCEREQLLHEALWPWIVSAAAPWQRWTQSVDGYASVIDKPSERVRDAVANAYPLPTTFAEAKTENDYWRRRRAEMEDVLGDFGDDGLDVVCRLRADMVRDLAEHVLPTTTLQDLHARFAMMRDSEIDEPKMEAALFRDLSVLVDREAAQPSTDPSSTSNVHRSAEPIRPHRHGQIADALRTDPSRSDRDIARAFGCSPTTAGKVRREIGLVQPHRSVQRRGGQVFRMTMPRRNTL